MCATFNVPASMSATPARLLVGFYKSLPPAGPPDKLGAQIDAPLASAGKPYALKMKGIDVTGDYFVYAVLYMPGGGQFQPKKGVDYVTQSAAAPSNAWKTKGSGAARTAVARANTVSPSNIVCTGLIARASPS